MVSISLALEELEVTGRALEGGEAPRAPATTLGAPAAIERRDRRGRADEPSQEKGA